MSSALSDYVSSTRYTRYRDDFGRLETWDEAVERVRNMHLEFYADKLSALLWGETLEYWIWEAFEAVKRKEVLPSMRSLQFGGKAILANHARQYNCLGRETPFVTSEGVKTFFDFEDGDTVSVLAPSGAWRNAIVRCYGRQRLQRIDIIKGTSSLSVRATANHRWLLKNGFQTTDLRPGDQLLGSAPIFQGFDYSKASPDERLYWAYGFVYGDGTVLRDADGVAKHSMVRLCNAKARFKHRFEELGFSTSSPLSCKGDFVAYTGTYLKTLPDLSVDSPDLVRAFVRGWLDADGARDSNREGLFVSLQTSGEENIEWIRKAFPVAGAFIVSENDLTGTETNYGVRGKTVSFRLRFACNGSSSFKPFKAASIYEDGEEEDVWCLEVEEEHAFVLPCGLVTGNCSFSPADRVAFFKEFFWLLLCGTGVGFSVQFKHVEKLPALPVFRHGKQTFIIPDTIEGWALAIDEQVRNALLGYHTDFDFSQIRPKGALLKTSGGRAPGPEPLRVALERTGGVLLGAGGRKLRPIEVYDICMHLAKAVLSGGIRRSATICLFSPDDAEMKNAKAEDRWWEKNPQRTASNNSAVLIRSTCSKSEFDALFEAQKSYGEPGFYFANSSDHGTNPCQPAWAPVLTPVGIRRMADIQENDQIWGGDRWVRVAKKWSTGVKDVYAYRTTAGVFYGTENHRVFSDGERVEAGLAESLDVSVCDAPLNSIYKPDSTVMDGIVFGDGSVHKASNDLVYLCVGEKDDYENSELSHLLVEKREGLGPTAWEVRTSLVASELPRTFDRQIPDRFFYGAPSTVAAFLRGLYSANGSICGDRVTLKASSFAVISRAQQMLSSLGIASYWTRNKAHLVKFENGTYECRESYDLNITRHRDVFRRLIGFVQAYKSKALEELCASKGPSTKPAKTSYEIREVEFVSREEVFDITVDSEEHAYWTGGCKVSNCAEIGLYPYDEYGRSGVQFCNLTTIAARGINSKVEFWRRATLASLIGTLQAGYTSFPFLGERSEKITAREALLGVSICGIMDNPKLLLDPETLQHGAAEVVSTNEDVAKILGINPAARTTCVKPEGTASIVLDSASGIHPRHAARYIRRVRASKADPSTKAFAEANPELVEDAYEDPTNTAVLTFACEAPAGSRLREDVSALELLEAARIVQDYWVKPGRRDSTVTDIHHNVSITVNVKPQEWEAVRGHIWANRDTYTGIALLQDYGDVAYPQAPLQTVRTAEDEAVFKKALQAVVPHGWQKDADHDTGEEHRGAAVACSGGACELKV